MTIQVKRCSFLSWEMPGNTRELKPGEEVSLARSVSEGSYVWTVRAVDKDRAKVTTELPYTVDYEGGLTLKPSKSTIVAEREKINGFGSANRFWRWKER